MPFKLCPMFDRLLVEQIPAEEKTKGGIIIPDTAKDPPLEGYVKSRGEGRLKPDGEVVRLRIKVGDRVLFGRYAGTELEMNRKQYRMLREDDIIGYFTEE